MQGLLAVVENKYWSILLSFLKESSKKAVTKELKEALRVHSHKVKKQLSGLLWGTQYYGL